MRSFVLLNASGYRQTITIRLGAIVAVGADSFNRKTEDDCVRLRMSTLITRRRLLEATAGGTLLPCADRAGDIPLQADVLAFVGTVAAMGSARKPLRLAILSFKGSSFWEAFDKGITAATKYLKSLNTGVDHTQLGIDLTPEVIVPAIDGALAKQ
jgi:hypothetical protein